MFKLGLRRVVPIGRLHWSAMRRKYKLAGAPPPVDYLSALPDDVGLMGNDQIGDCFEAAVYHGDQVRTLFADGAMVTQPDADVIKLYELATGYTPSDPSTDNGSDAGQTLSFIEDNGIPEGADGTPGKILVASFEIDPRNMSDVMEAMDDCGGLMVGVNATQNVMESKLWDYDPNSPVIGGHEIFCAKLLKPNANIGLISWGSPRYEMTQAFWANQVNQCTACVWQDWIEKTGKTPLGMTLDQLQSEMAAVGSGDIP